MPANASISRRGFIIGSIATSTLIGLGLAAKQFVGNEEEYSALCNGEKPEQLSIRELGILTTLCSRIIHPIEGSPSIVAARTARRIDREMSFASKKMASDVQSSLLYLEFSPLLHSKLGKFSGMSVNDQNAYISVLQNSKDITEKSIYNGLRFMIVFFYYTDERTWPSIGYKKPLMPNKLFPAGNQIANLPPLKNNRVL